VGIFISYLFFIPHNDAVKDLTLELNETKQTAMLSMLENNTAAERMKAVSYTQELKSVNDKIIIALFTTLNNDENENVRLATLDALVRFADNPKVREGLVASLLKQDSELMQVALANVMLQLQEKRSVTPLKKILENKNMNTLVKEKLEQTVKNIETSSL
jgi:HEAT repeat protein